MYHFLTNYIYIILLISCFSCQPPQEELAIPADKLLQILEDVHIAEAAMTGLSPQRKDSIARVYYDQIFTIHGVTEADFDHDLELLKSRPDQLTKAYTTLQQQIEKK